MGQLWRELTMREKLGLILAGVIVLVAVWLIIGGVIVLGS